MEYICLIFQIIFLLGTVFLPTGDTYLVEFKKIYKNYLIFAIIAQMLCFIANVIILFIFKEIMICILFLDIILTVLIKLSFSILAKNKYYKELKEMIIEERLETCAPNEIRRYLLEKFERVYFIKDIEKCLIIINN